MLGAHPSLKMLVVVDGQTLSKDSNGVDKIYKINVEHFVNDSIFLVSSITYPGASHLRACSLNLLLSDNLTY